MTDTKRTSSARRRLSAATASNAVASTGGPATGALTRNRAVNEPSGLPVGTSPSSDIDSRTNFSYLVVCMWMGERKGWLCTIVN
jgi:hypothetical protein